MSKVETVRALVEQRLAAAAEEIFGLFERTIAEYEQELCRSKEENERQQKLLDAVWKPGVRLHRADIQQLLVIKEDVPPEQHEWSPSPDQDPPVPPHITEDQEAQTEPPYIKDDQEDPPEPPHIKESHKDPPEPPHTKEDQEAQTEPPHIKQDQEEPPEPPHIKEEQEELFTPVPVKSEDDEGKPQSSQLHQRHTDQMETGADGEDCGGPQPAGNYHPETHLRPETENGNSLSSEYDTDDSDDWEETREPKSGSNPLQNKEKPLNDIKYITRKTSASSSECATSSNQQGQMQKQDAFGSTSKNTRVLSVGELFSCSICNKTCKRRRNVVRHMKIHTAEKPFSCSICGVTFRERYSMAQHLRGHKKGKSFNCSICKISVGSRNSWIEHMTIHPGKKLHCCSVCGKGYLSSRHLRRHQLVHTGEKRFSCSVCNRGFVCQGDMRRHLLVHTGEKKFSCNRCDKRFTRLDNLKKHKCSRDI